MESGSATHQRVPSGDPAPAQDLSSKRRAAAFHGALMTSTFNEVWEIRTCTLNPAGQDFNLHAPRWSLGRLGQIQGCPRHVSTRPDFSFAFLLQPPQPGHNPVARLCVRRADADAGVPCPDPPRFPSCCAPKTIKGARSRKPGCRCVPGRGGTQHSMPARCRASVGPSGASMRGAYRICSASRSVLAVGHQTP